jgi:hypothetical protein
MTDTIRTAAEEGLLDDVTQTHSRNKVWVLILELAPTDKQKSVTPSPSHSLMDAKHLYSTSTSNKRLTKQFFFFYFRQSVSTCTGHHSVRHTAYLVSQAPLQCVAMETACQIRAQPIGWMTEIVTISNTSHQTVMNVVASHETHLAPLVANFSCCIRQPGPVPPRTHVPVSSNTL